MTQHGVDMEKFREQVEAYKALKENVYDEFAEILRTVLTRTVNNLGISAIIQSRAKTIPSFANKVIHRQKEFPDPINHFRDLCGARVILAHKAAMEPMNDFIKKHFEIIRTENLQKRLGALEFGYQSVHYMVSLKSGEFTDILEEMKKERGERFKKALDNLLPDKDHRGEEKWSEHSFRAEIQVRTLLQHAWAEFAHDRTYKSAFHIPQAWHRDTSRIAATLEQVDDGIARNVQRMEQYRAYFIPHMSRQECDAETKKLEAVLEYVDLKADRLRICHEMAKFSLQMGDYRKAEATLEHFVAEWERSPSSDRIKAGWDFVKYPARTRKSLLDEVEEAEKILEQYRDPQMSGVLLDYGLSRWCRNEPDCRDYIEWAIALNNRNLDARIALAETYDGTKMLTCYEEAFKLDPSDPRILSGFVQSKIAVENQLDFISIIGPSIEKGIEICHERAKIGAYLPQAYYDIGLFCFLLGRTYESLAAYCKAAQMTDPELDHIDHTLKKVQLTLDAVEGRVSSQTSADLECIEKVLRMAGVVKKLQQYKAVRAEKPLSRTEKSSYTADIAGNELGMFASQKSSSFTAPIMIVAGGCDERVEEKMREYEAILHSAFEGFEGTIFCGGTRAGISGLVGDFAPLEKGAVRKVSYLPRTVSSRTQRHPAYEVFYTDGTGFSAQEPIQNWIDLLVAGIDPADVKVLGVNGGRISGFEFRLALMLGAKVGIIRDSGRAANDILIDEDWNRIPGLLNLPDDLQTVRLFVQGMPSAKVIAVSDREAMAKKAHEKFREGKKKQGIREDPAMADWKDLPSSLKNSNLAQVGHYEGTLEAAGFGLRKVEAGEPVKTIDFSVEEIRDKVEIMAEIEHGRWNVERLESGWTLGEEKDVEAKRHPDLIPWALLPDDIKEYDRNAVRAMPGILAKYGYEIIPIKDPED